MNDYFSYLQNKESIKNDGFRPIIIHDYLFDFQKHLVDWSLIKGRAAIFADCGLGKSAMELSIADNIVKHTNKPVLLLTPIAVGQQMLLESEKFGIESSRSRTGSFSNKIVITNYEQLHKFNPDDFAGVILDESSILKNFDGKIKHQINIFMRRIKYRYLFTATPSPNDFIELGTSSEVLGGLGYMDMLNKFFKNDENNCATNQRGRFVEATKWRLKYHAEELFWKWVASWSRAIRTPSDIGFSNEGYLLPEIKEVDHKLDIIGRVSNDMLFALPAKGLAEERQERNSTIEERCEKVAEIVNKVNDYSVVWCNLNKEGDLLEKLINNSVQVSGKDSDEKKEDKLISFSSGKVKKIITKPKIGAWGLNWQHCNHITYFPTHSFEQYYQSIRRCWRFGQKREVTVDLIFTEGDTNMINNMKRKKQQSIEMFSVLVKEMNSSIAISGNKKFNKEMEIPKWL